MGRFVLFSAAHCLTPISLIVDRKGRFCVIFVLEKTKFCQQAQKRMNLTTDPYTEKEEVPTAVPHSIKLSSQKFQNKTTAVDRYSLTTGPL